MPIHHHNHTLTWHQNTPHSSEYDDIYFNPEHGLEESRYAFLNSNHLPDRFGSVDTTQLTIAETGFGTGLNFLLTAHEWLSATSADQRLFFISVEKHPLKQEDLSKALQNWPQFSDFAEALVAQYPPASPGYHKLSFDNGRITLLLMFGDAAECYSELQANVDAWYLDGFAPAKNPDMWTEQLFTEMARLSHAGTTFSTFTAAGIVKRGLQAAGFTVSKQAGFGRKREMLIGQFSGNSSPEKAATPWFVIPSSPKPDEITIIGGGLAGCSTAYSLAQRGLKVRLVEKEKSLATGGSGNRQGALYAKLPVRMTKQGALHLTGFLYTVNQLKQIDPKGSFWSQCGVIQLALNDKEQKRQADLIASAHYPESVVQYHEATSLTSIANSRVLHDGLYFPSAGWVSPANLCQTLTQHPNIYIEQREITSLDHDGQHWLLQDSQGQVSNSSVVILCNAVLAKQFQQTEHLPLKAIRGQVSITRSDNLPKLTSVVCGDGYISPAKDQHYCFGATFDLTGKEANVTASDHQINMNNLSAALPELAAAISNCPEALEGRTAFRCATADYLPIIGPAPQYDAFIKTFARLRQDKKWRFEEHERAEHHPGLYINTGHGSKGLITCPLAGEILAAQLCNEPLPVPKTVLDAVNPARFIIKNLIKQAI